MLIRIMKLCKLISLVLLIILIKKMELMIYNGIGCKYNKILRLNSSYGVLVVDYKICFVSMLILKQLNKKMIGPQQQMQMVVNHNHNTSTLLPILVPKSYQKNLSKMIQQMDGQMVLVVPKYQEASDLHSRYTIEIQD